MIGFLSGKIIAIEQPNTLILEVQGVGYDIWVSLRTLNQFNVGQQVQLFTHTNVRENAIELFGFPTLWDRKVYHLLISVSGVGSKTALGILDALQPDAVLFAIVKQDRTALSSAQGVGKKTAERIILELSEKAQKFLLEKPSKASNSGSPSLVSEKKTEVTQKAVPAMDASEDSLGELEIYKDALTALIGLGYHEVKAAEALRKVDAKGQPLEKIIRSALREISHGI